MPSQFFGLNIGASALAAYQASLNTTANNIANVKTTGYTRQTTVLEAGHPLRVYTRYGCVGTGVVATEITQERNLYYDTKYWGNASSKGYFEQKLYYLDQVQTILKDDEDSQKGFTTIFTQMFDNGLDTLKTKGEDKSVRNQFIHEAQQLCSYFNDLSNNLKKMQADCNNEIKTSANKINSYAQKLAILNKQINNIEVRGGHANELRDQRANLIDELSELVDVETKEFEVTNSNGQALGGTNYRVYINGQILVDGNEYRTLDCISTEYKYSQMDIEGMYSLVWSDTGMDFATTGGTKQGSLDALFCVRDGNNKENMRGVVESVGNDRKTITMKNPTQTSMNELNLPERGQITVNNKHYTYEGWEATVGEDGITSITFQLTTTMSEDEANRLPDNQLICGVSVDAMGIPYYQSQINEFLRNFTQAFNDIEKKGVDLEGNPMGSFFVGESATGVIFDVDEWDKELADAEERKHNGGDYSFTFSSHGDSYYNITAETVCVNDKSLKDPNYFSTSSEIINGEAKYDIAEELLKLQKDVKMFRGDSAESFLETLLSDITVDVNKTEISSKNYANLATIIGNQRTSISGVDEDEEGLNLVKFQNCYNLAAKLITVMSEVYNKLINEMGVT